MADSVRIQDEMLAKQELRHAVKELKAELAAQTARAESQTRQLELRRELKELQGKTHA